MAKKKIGKGQLITELVKGSIDYAVNLIRQAFYTQFPYGEDNDYSINEVFADHVIVSDWRSKELKSDEYWKVTFSKEGDSFTFAAREAWEIVELTYQAQTALTPAPLPMGEGKKRKGKRIEERVNATVILEEREEGKARRIKIDGAITAGVVNGNNRRYPASVIESAVAELRGHLNESAGQGRAVQVLGEAEHPSDKGGRPNLLETVTKWEDVSFDGQRVDVTGRILETSKGKDILTLMEGGVMPGVSLRGYGEGKNIGKGEDKVFEVTELHITGFDLVLEPSFENSAELMESQNQSSMEDDMNLEELLKLLREHPEAFAGITEAQIKKMGEEQLKGLEDKVRAALGIDANANITEALKAMKDKAVKFDESQKRSEVEAAITEATKDLPFGKELNEAFVESIKEAELSTPDAVKKFAESKRKEYGKLAAKGQLKGMGFDEKKGLVVLGSVLENETGIPDFARASFEFQESLVKSENRVLRDVRKGESAAEVFTAKLLERFDKLNKVKLLQEAESTSDLNLPYSVSRAIIAEAFPSLVAANIFDVGIMNSSDERIYYEAFAGESGYTVAITDEVETAGAEDTWYALAHPRIVPGTVVVTSNPAGTTYVEGVDFVIDYELGKIKLLTAGAVDANDVLVDYEYNAIRQGEDAEIQRAKTTLSYQLVTAAADRLADYITHEAIVFSRANLGWDAVTRTMANLIRQMRLNIDKGLIEKALAGALGVASNSGGTWTAASDPWALLAEYIGYAKVKVANRYYEPTGILMSQTNADYLSNWDGMTRVGFPNAVLNAAGFAGGVKGLPIFASTQMRDTWILVFNREIVAHRVFQPMTVKGPFQTFGSNRNLIAAEQYYAEEYNASICPIGGKASFVKVA